MLSRTTTYAVKNVLIIGTVLKSIDSLGFIFGTLMTVPVLNKYTLIADKSKKIILDINNRIVVRIKGILPGEKVMRDLSMLRKDKSFSKLSEIYEQENQTAFFYMFVHTEQAYSYIIKFELLYDDVRILNFCYLLTDFRKILKESSQQSRDLSPLCRIPWAMMFSRSTSA